MNGGIALFIEDNLDHTCAVAHVDKNDVAEITAAVHPAHEDSFLLRIRKAQRAAHVGTSQVA